jgi:hypothetical protein
MGAYSLLGRQAMDCGDIVWQRCFKKPSYNEVGRKWDQGKKFKITKYKTVDIYSNGSTSI